MELVPIDEIEERAKAAATQSYLDCSDCEPIAIRDGYYQVGGAIVPIERGSHSNYGQDALNTALFYAMARGDVLALVDEVRRLRADLQLAEDIITEVYRQPENAIDAIDKRFGDMLRTLGYPVASERSAAESGEA